LDLHNGSCAIHKLVPEIFELIFLYLQPLDRNVYSWIKVTHVCRYWRTTALAAKALWCRIVINGQNRSINLAQTFFERSNPLPIELEHGCYASEEGLELDTFYRALSDSPHRIAVLNLRGKTFHKKAWDLLQRQLPNITGISLWSRRIHPVEGEDLKNVDFLGGRTDTLRKLHLKGYSWPQVPFPALTHLYLENQFTERIVFPIEFFSLLKSASSTLEVLHMQDMSPLFDLPQIYAPPPLDKRIHMLSLRYVEIHQFFEDSSVFPLLFLQNLVCPCMETIVWDVEYMCTWPPHEWNPNMLPPNHHLLSVTKLVGRSFQKLCYVLKGATLYADLWLASHMSALTVAFLGRYFSNVKLLALLALPSEYHLKRDILRVYSSVTSLHLDWYDDLLDVLVDLEGHEDMDGDNTAICPNLETLTIYTGENLKANTHRFRPGLKAHRLPMLRLSSSQSTRRKRRQHGTRYTLQFRSGDINDISFEEDQ